MIGALAGDSTRSLPFSLSSILNLRYLPSQTHAAWVSFLLSFLRHRSLFVCRHSLLLPLPAHFSPLSIGLEPLPSRPDRGMLTSVVCKLARDAARVDILSLEIVHRADVVQAAARNKVARRRICTRHHPARAQWNGVALCS